ncbi:MAG: type II toxin-antitoxin system HicA family toxin [Thermoplasmataceae archaeon]
MSGRKVINALPRIDYNFDHQISNHIILRNWQGHGITTTKHTELDRGTLRSMLNDAGLATEEFLGLL